MFYGAEVVFKEIEEKEAYIELIENVIQKCFEVENINSTSFYISVTLTNPKVIKQLNKDYRNIDKETDVLSFPMFEKAELEGNLKDQEKQSVDSGILQYVLGDIIISVDRVYEQAKEYGHSFEREFAYMLVHGFYHVVGYDHMQEEDKKEMRKKEENVLNMLNMIR